ncbi:adenine deaminase [Candidatus Desantisbacteria bacterium]|nr:adenine deaminase [Candidatus Desantisbacteria bacterium]
MKKSLNFIVIVTLFFSFLTLSYAENKFEGNIIDVNAKRIFYGEVIVKDNKISKVSELGTVKTGEKYIMPGLVDAHVHIESSMLIPSEFARLSAPHGNVATVSDPHEIANVLGIEGINYMIKNGETVPYKFYFGAPPCVPATAFETSGDTLGVKEIENLLDNKNIKYLAEMMNYPGVLFNDKDVMAKIKAAKDRGLPVDGHAPLVTGKDLEKYINAGITTDHEATSFAEGEEKIKLGMKIIIREGSAAKNFEALSPLIPAYPDMVMFGSDDKHPDDLVKGHIDELIKRSLKKGYDAITVIREATYIPVKHYKLNVGLLQEGDSADFIIVNNLNDFQILATFIEGQKVAENGKTLINNVKKEAPQNNFKITSLKEVKAFTLKSPDSKSIIKTIVAIDGSILTESDSTEVKVDSDGNAISNIEKDILKIIVLNRYAPSAVPAIGFIKGFGIKNGAIAGSVAHDSHNIVAIGTNDKAITEAVNLLIENKGGLAAVYPEPSSGKYEKFVVPLPVAGLMSEDDGYQVAEQYQKIDQIAKKNLGSKLKSPYMTMSFMALLVIPRLKLSDKGLFDVSQFKPVPLFLDSASKPAPNLIGDAQ